MIVSTGAYIASQPAGLNATILASDALLDAYISARAATVFHPVGSAGMSPQGAEWGVVDPDLRVKGVRGLRIVDLSVMPLIPGAHTQASAYTFSVNWVNESHRGASDGKVFVDGVLCGGKIIREDAGLPATRRKSGLTDGLTLKRFMFSAIESESPAPANEKDSESCSSDPAPRKGMPNPNLGLIKLVIFPVIVGEETEGGKKQLPRMKCSEGTITQQVQLSAVENLKRPQKISHTQKTGPPLVTFCFKYRSRDELRRLEIVPPSPSPPALKHISKPVEDSVDLALCPRPSPTQSIVYSPNASPSPLRPVAASQPEARVLKPKPFPLPSPARFKLESSQDGLVGSSRKRVRVASTEEESVIDLTLDDAPTRVEGRPRKRVKHEDDGIIDLT
ncbi:hypothetical protein HMN09_00740700 [Mycena chlorophos]|uniref:Glucose-methanol-choline oxidoreductase C-terminal domain-containing protein n=1 Tax=Mycena chlorophos TaxID=658473 RepID=A0A8H6W7J5_MYCCL|nr:hypothetical protein HMN09_00740700 [Mycena chlorophos]